MNHGLQDQTLCELSLTTHTSPLSTSLIGSAASFRHFCPIGQRPVAPHSESSTSVAAHWQIHFRVMCLPEFHTSGRLATVTVTVTEPPGPDHRDGYGTRNLLRPAGEGGRRRRSRAVPSPPDSRRLHAGPSKTGTP
jgi:hypothetical protein